ncbi:MAG: lycopene cyclase domain-containing protein [Rubricoccaceae bacterium]
MTYLQFHFVYILPVIVLLALLQARPMAGIGARRALTWLGAILAIAFTYTTPWDNYLVYRDVWGYGPDRVLATIGYVPVEEYLFFLLQPILVGLFYFLLRGRGWLAAPSKAMPAWFRPLAATVCLLLAALGAVFLATPPENTLYMGLILAWALPVLAALFWIGGAKVWEDRRRVLAAVAVPTVWLWFADRMAIADGIWYIADATRLGIDPLGLPVEEATFFLVTSALCAVGLALFLPRPADVAEPPHARIEEPALP